LKTATISSSFILNRKDPNTLSATSESPNIKRFNGFRNTPFLWKEEFDGLNMFNQTKLSPDASLVNFSTDKRLGHLVEEFVAFELNEDISIEILRTKAQIVHQKRTVGELDCLLKRNNEAVHLEIIYKIYLYDPSISGELERWTGPNRNDSLVKKLSKLKDQQLPLLHHSGTKSLLGELNIDVEEVKQVVLFKAQLFVPLDNLEQTFPQINNDCVSGFYIRRQELDQFSNHKFHIPAKLDWLVEPHEDVQWDSNEDFQEKVEKLLKQKKSPLCWMKSSEGTLQKFFIVWWE
jgi:hypothetical protein